MLLNLTSHALSVVLCIESLVRISLYRRFVILNSLQKIAVKLMIKCYDFTFNAHLHNNKNSIQHVLILRNDFNKLGIQPIHTVYPNQFNNF